VHAPPGRFPGKSLILVPDSRLPDAVTIAQLLRISPHTHDV